MRSKEEEKREYKVDFIIPNIAVYFQKLSTALHLYSDRTSSLLTLLFSFNLCYVCQKCYIISALMPPGSTGRATANLLLISELTNNLKSLHYSRCVVKISGRIHDFCSCQMDFWFLSVNVNSKISVTISIG